MERFTDWYIIIKTPIYIIDYSMLMYSRFLLLLFVSIDSFSVALYPIDADGHTGFTKLLCLTIWRANLMLSWNDKHVYVLLIVHAFIWFHIWLSYRKKQYNLSIKNALCFFHYFVRTCWCMYVCFALYLGCCLLDNFPFSILNLNGWMDGCSFILNSF